MSFVHERIIRMAVKEDTYVHCLHRAEEALDFISYNSVFSSGNDLPRPGLILLGVCENQGFLEKYSKLPEQVRNKSAIILLTNSLDNGGGQTYYNHPEVKDLVSKSLTTETVRKLVEQYFE